MIIYVPEGNSNDLTRLPGFYNAVVDFLELCGVTRL